MIPLKVPTEKERLREDCLSQMLDGLEKSDSHFTPAWSNVAYWYPPEMLKLLVGIGDLSKTVNGTHTVQS